MGDCGQAGSEMIARVGRCGVRLRRLLCCGSLSLPLSIIRGTHSHPKRSEVIGWIPYGVRRHSFPNLSPFAQT